MCTDPVKILITNSIKMELLSNDLKLIVYRLLHHDVYLQVQQEFISKYVQYWSEQCNCYELIRHYYGNYKVNGRNIGIQLLPKGNRYVIFDINTGYTSRRRIIQFEMGFVVTPLNY